MSKGPSESEGGAYNVEEAANDPLFGLDGDEDPSESEIFANRNLLVVGTVIEEDRIVGRDEEVQDVAKQVRYIVHGEQPNHVFVTGETGTGKSLVSRHVCRRAVRAANARGNASAVVYVECKSKNTETRVARTIARELNEDSGGEMDIPRFGVGSTEYFDFVYDILKENYDSVLVILDEIDKLDGGADIEVLHELSRAREAGHTDTHIGIVAISNQIEYGKELNARVDSSMRTEEFMFEPYDYEQLKLILENRRDGFKPGVLQEGVIEEAADMSADEHGDARKAVDILRISGDLAVDAEDTKVTLSHLNEAKRKAEIDRVREAIESTTNQAKLVLYALSKLAQNENRPYKTSEVYDRYQLVAGDVRSTAVSDERVYQILKTMSLLGVTESTKASGGDKQGVYLEHELLRPPSVTLSAVLNSDSRLRKLENIDSPD